MIMKPTSPSASLPLLFLLSLTAIAAPAPQPRPEACLGYTCQSWLRQAIQSDLAHADDDSQQSLRSTLRSGEDEAVSDSASSLHVPSHHVLPLTTLAYRLADRKFNNRPRTPTHDVSPDVALASEGPLESTYLVAVFKSLSTPASDVLVVVDSEALPAKPTSALEKLRELESLQQLVFELELDELELDGLEDVVEGQEDELEMDELEMYELEMEEVEDDVEGQEDELEMDELEMDELELDELEMEMGEPEFDEVEDEAEEDVREEYDDSVEELEDDEDILDEMVVEELLKSDELRYWLTESTIHLEHYPYVPMDEAAASECGGDEEAAICFRSRFHLTREPGEGVVVGLVIIFLAGIVIVETLDYFSGAESKCRCSDSNSRTSMWRGNRLGRIRLEDEECVKSWSRPALTREDSVCSERLMEKSLPPMCVVNVDSDVDGEVEGASESEKPHY